MARTKTTGRKAEAPKVHVRVAEEEAVFQKVDVAKPDRPCAHVGIQDVSDQRPHEHLQQAPCHVVADAGVADAGKRAAALPAHDDMATAQPARNNATQATVSHSPTAVRGPDEPVTDHKKIQAAAEAMNADVAAPLGRGCRKRTARQRLAEPEAEDSATLVPNTRANGMSPTQAKAMVSNAPSPSAKGHASSPRVKAHAAAPSAKADATSPGTNTQKRPREESASASAKPHADAPSAKADATSPGTNEHKRPREESPNGGASSGAGAGSSGTLALVQSPTPPSPLRPVQSVFTTRTRRSRKGAAMRSSE